MSTDSSTNFLKAFKRYQGLEHHKIPNSLYQELDAYFTKLGYPTGEEIRQLPLDSQGRRGPTNRYLLRKALFDLGYTRYYEDIGYIAKIYWDWSLPKITCYNKF